MIDRLFFFFFFGTHDPCRLHCCLSFASRTASGSESEHPHQSVVSSDHLLGGRSSMKPISFNHFQHHCLKSSPITVLSGDQNSEHFCGKLVSFWGFRPQTRTGAPPLNPAEGLPSSRPPRICCSLQSD